MRLNRRSFMIGSAGAAGGLALGLQLPFAILPLIMITSSRPKMGALVAPVWLTALAGVIAAIVIGLNAKVIVDFVWG